MFTTHISINKLNQTNTYLKLDINMIDIINCMIAATTSNPKMIKNANT